MPGYPQTTVVYAPPVGREGMIADETGPQDIMSRKVKTTAGLYPGRAVMDVTGSTDQCDLIATDLSKFLGFTVWDAFKESRPDGYAYGQNEMANIIRVGTIWLVSADAMDNLVVPYINLTTGQLQTASTGGAQLATGAIKILRGSTGTFGLVKVRVNLP